MSNTTEPSNGDDKSFIAFVTELIAKTPTVKGRLMRVLMGEEEPKAVPSYYRESFAKELLPTLDDVLSSRKTYEFRYEDFPNINRKTLYLKIYYAWAYIIKEMDSVDHKYLKLREETELAQKKTGVRITFISDMMPLRGVPVEFISKPAFRKKIDDFLETGKESEALHITKLSLTMQEVADLQASLTGIDNLVWLVTGTSVKLIKVSTEEYQQWKNR